MQLNLFNFLKLNGILLHNDYQQFLLILKILLQI